MQSTYTLTKAWNKQCSYLLGQVVWLNLEVQPLGCFQKERGNYVSVRCSRGNEITTAFKISGARNLMRKNWVNDQYHFNKPELICGCRKAQETSAQPSWLILPQSAGTQKHQCFFYVFLFLNLRTRIRGRIFCSPLCKLRFAWHVLLYLGSFIENLIPCACMRVHRMCLINML